MLKELGVYLDEPRSLTDVQVRKAYNLLVGRDPDMQGLQLWGNLIATGTQTIGDIVANAALYGEVTQYLAQGNGNPVFTLIRRDNDGNAELYEAAFNTQFDRANLGYQVTGDIISLPYDNAIYIQNKLASSNVNINPYGVVSFIGSLTLNPPDNSVQPSVTSTPSVQNDPNDNYTTIVNNFKQQVASKEGKVVSKDDDSGFYGSYYGEWELLNQGATELDPADNKIKRVDTYVKYRVDFSIKPNYQTVTKSGQRRDVVYDENLKPKMSDIRINFSARGMKPNTRVNAFFGDRNVSAACIAYTERPDGSTIISDQLVTNSRGEVRGTFNYSEKDLNFDAGMYVFALSDSSRNDNDRNTSPSAIFNGLGLTGYAEETFRTRIPDLTVNKTSTVTVSDPRTVIVGEGSTVTPPATPSTATTDIDMIEIMFVYGFGRRPDATEKAAIYDKWVDYGVSSMTTWNAIVMTNPASGANTNGNELFREYGFLNVDPILEYVDRAISVVPNGSDSADLRTKYLAAATYNYGKYSFHYEHNQPTFPATINYRQFLNLDPTQNLTAPYLADLSYDCFNAEGKKAFNAIYNFFYDVWGLIGGWKTAQDYQGVLGFNARWLNFVQYDAAGTASLGTPQLPRTYAYVRDTSNISNVHQITTVWDTYMDNNCMQPYRVVQGPPSGGSGPGNLLSVTVTPAGNWPSETSWITADISGNVAAANGGDGTGPGFILDLNSYPIETSATGSDPHNWTAASPVTSPIGSWVSNTGNTLLPGQPYQLIATHYGNYTTQILFGIKLGQTANTVNVPIRIVCQETGGIHDSWIPGSASAFWDSGLGYEANFVDVYTGYKGSDPLGITTLNNARQPYTLQIFVRNDVAASIPAPNGGFNGTTGGGGGGAGSGDNTFVQGG